MPLKKLKEYIYYIRYFVGRRQVLSNSNLNDDFDSSVGLFSQLNYDFIYLGSISIPDSNISAFFQRFQAEFFNSSQRRAIITFFNVKKSLNQKIISIIHTYLLALYGQKNSQEQYYLRYNPSKDIWADT